MKSHLSINRNQMNKTFEYDLEAKGYIDVAIDPTIDLVAEINRLKKEKNAVILAHYYQESENSGPC